MGQPANPNNRYDNKSTHSDINWAKMV